MRNYEIMYILRADLDEAARTAENEKLAKLLTDNGGKVNKTDLSWGVKDLAYEIKDQKKGFYVILKVTAGDQALYQFNRKIKINPNVLRHIVVVDHE